MSGTAERPRLAVHFSAHHVYAQVIDDDAGKTLAAVSTLQKDLAGKKAAANRESAERVGKAIAEKLLAKKVENVVFDRGGYIFHGKVKALADAARDGVLKFLDGITQSRQTTGSQYRQNPSGKRRYDRESRFYQSLREGGERGTSFQLQCTHRGR